MKRFAPWICLFLVGLIGTTRVACQPRTSPIHGILSPVTFKEGLWIKKYPKNFTCFKIENPAHIKIITDPFYMDETVQADIVTVSHKHYDHEDLSRISGGYKILNQSGTFFEKGVKITGVEGYHNQDNLGQNTIYVFDWEDIRLAQFASQGCMRRSWWCWIIRYGVRSANIFVIFCSLTGMGRLLSFGGPEDADKANFCMK